MDSLGLPAEGDNQLAPNAEGEAVAVPEDQDKSQDSFMLSFADKDSAEKGYKEVQAAKTRAEQRAAELESEMQKLRDQRVDDIGKAVQQLAQGQSQPQVDPNVRVKELADRFGVDEQLLDYVGSFTLDQADQVRNEVAEQMKELKSLIQQTQGSVGNLQVEMNPTFQSHREKVLEVAKEFDMDLATATKLVGKLAPKVESESGSTPIGGMSSSAVSNRSATSRQVSPQEIAMMKKLGCSDEDIAGYNQRAAKAGEGA